MSKPLPFTQATLRCTIAAALASGLRVTAIRPDGTVIVDEGDAQAGIVPSDTATMRAEDTDELIALL